MVGRRWRPESGMGVFGLLALLVTAAILLALVVAIVPRYTGAGTGAGSGTAPQGKAESPVRQAEGAACMSNLTQLRQAITMYQSMNEGLPANLQALGAQGMTPELLTCPVGGAQYTYQYDARSGKVECRCPGHERY